jgi:hypothetical protein
MYAQNKTHHNINTLKEYFNLPKNEMLLNLGLILGYI